MIIPNMMGKMKNGPKHQPDTDVLAPSTASRAARNGGHRVATLHLQPEAAELQRRPMRLWLKTQGKPY
jgi:hypothetical protein